jgi:anthranilate synthase component 2
MKVALIDNFDSFTYNLVHYIEPFADIVDVYRNDAISDYGILNKYDKIVFSPGTGLPSGANSMFHILNLFAEKKQILGICLGHQAIAEYFGASLFNMNKVHHGVAMKTIVTDSNETLFQSLPETFFSGRYHSWAVSLNEFPDCLKITAVDEENTIMAISHKIFTVKGIQFHPESILTEHGKQIIENWMKF